jgi:hypothetical protein
MSKWSVSEGYLDQLWSKAVNARYNGICPVCGRKGCHAHHIFPRRKRVLRWDINNGIYLCPVCHDLAHKQQSKFYRLTDNIIPYIELEEKDMNLVDYCATYGVTKNEFRLQKKNELQRLIKLYLEDIYV